MVVDKREVLDVPDDPDDAACTSTSPWRCVWFHEVGAGSRSDASNYTEVCDYMLEGDALKASTRPRPRPPPRAAAGAGPTASRRRRRRSARAEEERGDAGRSVPSAGESGRRKPEDEEMAVKAEKRKAKPAKQGGDAPAEKKRRSRPPKEMIEPVAQEERRVSLIAGKVPATRPVFGPRFELRSAPVLASTASRGRRRAADEEEAQRLEAQRREQEARREAAADDAARRAAGGAFDAAPRRTAPRAVDDALGDLEALLRGPYAGAERAGLNALLAPRATRQLVLYRAHPSAHPRLDNIDDDVALVKYLAHASDEDASKSTAAISADLRAQAPRLYLRAYGHQTDIFLRLRSPSARLLDAIGRSEFPDLDDDARHAAALDYVRAAMAKRPQKRKRPHSDDAVAEDPPKAEEEQEQEQDDDDEPEPERQVGEQYEYEGKMWLCCRENDTIASIAAVNGFYQDVLLAANRKHFGSDLKLKSKFKARTAIELPQRS
ncbi:hypothetical protein SO694_00030392 [Aureococcus anophagefferens]|uniref:LysM domain-containing protein n=1 Tax=Aureococcus anophagefferens TaxID=44056 RepID=A0ABR1FK33_AURAN